MTGASGLASFFDDESVQKEIFAYQVGYTFETGKTKNTGKTLKNKIHYIINGLAALHRGKAISKCFTSTITSCVQMDT